jgi:tetratricopeptide (TPR) repeat protein
LAKYDSAKIYLDTALNYVSKTDNIFSSIHIYANYGLYYSRLGQYDSSIKYCYKSLESCDKINATSEISGTLIILGEAYCLKKEYEKGFTHLQRALIMSDSLSDFYDRKEVLSILYKESVKMKNNQYSLKYGSLYINVMDSITKREAENFSELIKSYKETYKKNTQLFEYKKKQDQDRNLLIQGTIGIIALIIIFGLILRSNRQNAKIKDLKNRQRLEEIDFINSHKTRAPVARILGLASLFNYNKTDDPINSELVQKINDTALELDNHIRDITDRVEKKS